MNSTSCYLHPENEVELTCENCNQGICQNDKRMVMVTKKLKTEVINVCPPCEINLETEKTETTLKNKKIANIVTLISIIGVVIYVIIILT